MRRKVENIILRWENERQEPNDVRKNRWLINRAARVTGFTDIFVVKGSISKRATVQYGAERLLAVREIVRARLVRDLESPRWLLRLKSICR